VYSQPFHAPAGKSLHVDVSAQFQTSGTPATFGVDVWQCCGVSDSKITNTQEIGDIGRAGAPSHIVVDVPLSDECTISTHEGTDLVYYLRIYNASQGDQVIISYTVS
jgi:hypothetical protein